MKVETISHKTGDQLPILLDDDGLPIPAPNEFIISRRELSSNTLVRNLRELAVLYRWLDFENINLYERILTKSTFTEATIKGSLIEALRRDQENRGKVKKMAVTPNTFNQRLTTVRQYLGWYFDVELGSMPLNDSNFELVRENKNRILNWLDSGFMSASPTNKGMRKGLNGLEIEFLLSILDPETQGAFGRNSAVKFRNYIVTMIMLYYGLRPGELLSLRVEDIEIGAISNIRVFRRPPDVKDTRKPRPQIKRDGRVLPIDDSVFAKYLDMYIMEWRDALEEKSDSETDYLILSDDGEPLSQSSITQFYQLLRRKFPSKLPPHLTARAFRHTFSSNMERELRNLGIEEQRRREILAMVRGDSSLESQSVYIAQEIEEQANKALKKYQHNLISEDVPW